MKSEVTKNQGTLATDTDNKTNRMYETGTDICPMKSYHKYLSNHNTTCDALFQTPRDPFGDRDGVWYEKRPLGKNKLGCMMSEISKISKLSKKYTNHCIRATAITALDQARFAPRHIMSVSGHRSEASIKNYSRKTSTDQKRKMSETLGKLIPLSSGCTTIDENEADNLKKKTLTILIMKWIKVLMSYCTWQQPKQN